MKTSIHLFPAAAALAMLTACSPGADDPEEDLRPTDPGTPVVAVDDPGVTNPDGFLRQDPAREAAPEGTIPTAVRGRWGMVQADCEPGRADAKGMLEIDATTLTFYESSGKLDEVAERSDRRIRADFDFTGEGMTWQRDMALDLQDGGETLVRREYGPDASAEPFRYSKCD